MKSLEQNVKSQHFEESTDNVRVVDESAGGKKAPGLFQLAEAQKGD